MNLTQSSSPIEICFGGISPLSEHNGLTTCYGIYIPSTHEHPSVGIIVDNGTGIHNVVKFFNERKPEKMIQLQTHCHLDHLIGLRFNSFLSTPGRIDHSLISSYEETMHLVVGRRFDLHPIDTALYFGEKCLSKLDEYGIQIKSVPLPHGTKYSFGFNITGRGKIIMVATDCELLEAEDQQKFALSSKDADMIIMDCGYDYPKDYTQGWGHNYPGIIASTLLKRSTIGSKPTHLVIVHRKNRLPKEEQFIKRVLTPWMSGEVRNGLLKMSVPKDGDIMKL
ncbi:MAG: MBL fold metallo-hydrolase [Minisyncoccota bacterium]